MARGRAFIGGVVVAASLGFGVGAVATSGASNSASSTVYFGCLKAGSLTNVTTLSHSCATGASRISWNATGPAGLTGATGLKGNTGATGAQGDAGARGPAGSKGDTGAAGQSGPQGVQGLKGDQGIQGPKGDTGAIGPAPASGYYAYLAAGTPNGRISCPDGSLGLQMGAYNMSPYVGSGNSLQNIFLCPFPTN